MRQKSRHLQPLQKLKKVHYFGNVVEWLDKIKGVMDDENIVLTCALTYANGSLHIGHMLEYIQADIFKRYHVLRGKSCVLIGGSDMHGTPIMISAKEVNMSSEEMAHAFHLEHAQELRNFYIDFDHYGHTHTKDNETLIQKTFQSLLDASLVEVSEVRQVYDSMEHCFLSDRYVKGDCPFCASVGQYGDMCESCGKTYHALDLKNAISTLSHTPVEIRLVKQYSFQIHKIQSIVVDWLHQSTIDSHLLNKLEEWLAHPLKAIAFSRPYPYFGFLIPGEDALYFYVWFDALLGYISIYESKNKYSWNKTHAVYHFIGKDIVYFHAVIWPGLLYAMGLRFPTKIIAHGHVLLDSKKMSKSQKRMIHAKTWSKNLPTELLRFYFASRVHNLLEDMNMTALDIKSVVNDQLIDKFINILSRSATLICRNYDGALSVSDQSLMMLMMERGNEIMMAYQKVHYARVVECVLQLSDKVNYYFNHHRPWIGASNKELHAQNVCTTAIHAFYVLTCYMQPILPVTAEKVANYLQSLIIWPHRDMALPFKRIITYSPLFVKLTDKSLSRLFEDYE